MKKIIKKYCKKNKTDLDRNNNELNLQKLTPEVIDDMNYYKEALDYAFSEPDILNIAITGAYGAGKSSVIETYENLYSDKEFLHVSLTKYEQTSKNENKTPTSGNKHMDKGVKNNVELDESELEGKIINQLIHQIDLRKVSHTRFKVRADISWLHILRETLLICIFLILMLYIFKFKELQVLSVIPEIIPIDKHLEVLANYKTLTYAIVGCLIILTIYVYRLIKVRLYRPIFKKIRWKNGEIEIFGDDNESYFNKYLDEILYLFRKAEVDVIVFEDIDRYDDNMIFTKLKEINDLINNKKSRGKSKKTIKFLYLIRDDLFTSKDRTKFFDFIMPIIPVIDSSNSYDKLLERFKKAGPLNNNNTFLDELDGFFLRDISLYIDDMRLLKNIYNEYIIYYGRLQIIKLDPNKLFGLILYKNIFPKDFIELQLNKGFVNNIFKNKDPYIRIKKNELSLEIQRKQDNIKSIKDEFLNDLDELDALYLTSGEYNYRVNGKSDNSFDSRLDYIREMKKSDSEIDRRGYNGYVDCKFKDIVNEFNDKPDYIKRKNLIEQKMNNKIEELEKDIMELELERNRVESLKLADLLKKDYVDINELFKHNLINDEGQLIKYEDVVNNHYYPLIKYLVRNGYIDETRFDYLSYFYEDSLTINDKIFLRGITDGEAREYDYALNDPKIVLTYLKPITLEEKEALNFDLLKHLLDNDLLDNNSEYLFYILKQIKNNEKFDFAWDYIIQASNIDKFVKKLNIEWKEIWEYLVKNKEISDKKKKEYMIYTLHYSDLEDIQEMNINSCITNVISEDPNFMDIDNPNITKIIDAFKMLEVCFEYIDYNVSNEELFREVYKNNLYELNIEMIELILEKEYKISPSSDYKEKNYTLISSQSDQPLKHYVDINIDNYIELMLSNLSETIRDSEDNVIAILNNSKIDDTNKIGYIDNLSTTVSELKEIKDNNLWEELFKNNIINYSSKNILEYYFGYSSMLDQVLIDFLNNNPREIKFDYEGIEEDYGEDTSKFFIDVIKNNEIIDEKYEMVLKGYNQSIDKFDIDGIMDEKLTILINLDIIDMAVENLQFIRVNYPGLAMCFIINNIKEYIEILDSGTLIEEEILELLDENLISNIDKINLAEKFPGNISLKDSGYNDDLQIYIIENKFEINELGYFVSKYNSSSKKMKDAIVKLCIDNINVIHNNKYLLPYSLLHELMIQASLDDNNKKVIISNNIDQLKGFEVKELMSTAGFEDFVGLFELKRPLIDVTDENLKLLEHFKKRGWITDFSKNKTGTKYRAHGTKYKSNSSKLSLSDELL